MKKILLIILILLTFGCEKTEYRDFDKTNSFKELIVVNDKVYIQLINAMYSNPDEYQQDNIEMEGIWTTTSNGHHFVLRKTPGCCPVDDYTGLEVNYEGPLPKENDWVLIRGIYKPFSDALNEYKLDIYYLEIKEERGNETLTNWFN